MEDMLISSLNLTLAPLTVPENISIDDLIEHFITEPTMRHIYVVDESKKLLGIYFPSTWRNPPA